MSSSPSRVPQEGQRGVEIFVSTEKSGSGPDGWMTEVAQAFNAAGIRRFIAKPWKDYELIAAIGQSLALRAAAVENQSLADEMRLARGTLTAEDLERRRLEAEEPGITHVNWGPDGSVLLDESLLDPRQKPD